MSPQQSGSTREATESGASGKPDSPGGQASPRVSALAVALLLVGAGVIMLVSLGAVAVGNDFQGTNQMEVGGEGFVVILFVAAVAVIWFAFSSGRRNRPRT